jgi:hypothetical protein
MLPGQEQTCIFHQFPCYLLAQDMRHGWLSSWQEAQEVRLQQACMVGSQLTGNYVTDHKEAGSSTTSEYLFCRKRVA